MNARALGPVPATHAARPSAAAPATYPRRFQPARLRHDGLRRGWHCELTAGQRRAKRALDLAVCLLMAAPALVIVGLAVLAIRLESAGPALLAQPRVGRDGRPFRMWKLRTMVANAAALESSLQHLNELAWPDFKISRDPRITRVGAWLRRTSIDELPQLWNVLRGEMSMVGPRPTLFGLDTYELWQTERLAVAPGLTGLWQILARAQCDFPERLRLDLAYIRNWRLLLDVQILLATVGAVLAGRGAK